MHFTFLDGGGVETLELLAEGRFRLSQSCGVTNGLWRPTDGERDGGYRFSPEGLREGCERNVGARKLNKIFTGYLDAALGPNSDIALFAGRSGAVRARMAR